MKVPSDVGGFGYGLIGAVSVAMFCLIVLEGDGWEKLCAVIPFLFACVALKGLQR